MINANEVNLMNQSTQAVHSRQVTNVVFGGPSASRISYIDETIVQDDDEEFKTSRSPSQYLDGSLAQSPSKCVNFQDVPDVEMSPQRENAQSTPSPKKTTIVLQEESSQQGPKPYQDDIKSVFYRLYENAKDLNFKRDFQKQMAQLQEEQARQVGKRLTLSGSKSASRLFDYTLKQKQGGSLIKAETESSGKAAMTEEEKQILKSASNDRIVRKYLKVEEQINCRFAPAINRKSVILDQRRKESLLCTLMPGSREEELSDDEWLVESANLSKKLNATPILGHARHKSPGRKPHENPLP